MALIRIENSNTVVSELRTEKEPSMKAMRRVHALEEQR